MTIHRLLDANPAAGGSTRNEAQPLECDLLVVETSMVDVLLLNNLLRVLQPGASLLVVGDVDQLPSVWPGMVLRHIVDSSVVPVVRLANHVVEIITKTLEKKQDQQTCSNRHFYRANRCQRFTPQVVTLGAFQSNSRQPYVNPVSWCGVWVAKQDNGKY